MLYTKESIRSEIYEMGKYLQEPSSYFDGVGKFPGEPSNIVFLWRNQNRRINRGEKLSRLRHERYVLTVNLMTEGLVCVEGQTLHLPVNFASLVQPYQLHYYMVNQTNFAWLVITFEMGQQEIVKNLTGPCVPMNEIQYIRLYRMLQIYLDILAGNTKQEILLQRMLGNFIREMNLSEMGENTDDGSDEVAEQINEFEKINKYIFTRLGDPALNLNDIADNLNMSVTKLYSIFRVMSACNPGEYIRNQRLRRAMRMLELNELPIAEVARQNGFSSLAIFSRCFNKVVGLAPSKFANKNRTH